MNQIFGFIGNNSAEITALCALLFTAWNVFVQRKHNILSVRPHLARFVYSDHDGEIGTAKFELINNGLGPAFIKKFEVYLDGKLCDYDVALNYVVKDLPCKWQRTRLGDDYAMRSGGVKDIFVIIFPCASDDELTAVKEKFNRLDISIDYECAYGKERNFNTFEKPKLKGSK